METPKRKPFNTRAFTVLVAALAGLGLPITGLANHLHQMDAMTFQRHTWMSVHNILGTVFLVFGLWHVILNRRPLVRYVSGLAGRFPGMSREALWAAVLIAVVLVAVVGHALHAGGN